MASAALVACATAKAPPGQPELKNLSIEGNHALSDRQIKGRLATEDDSWLPLTDAKYLDRAVLRSDEKRVVRFYQAQGYYSAQVTDTEVNPVKDKTNMVEVKIHVDEGEPTKVGELHVDGLEGLSMAAQRDVVVATKPLKAGEIFLEDDYDDVKAALGKILRNDGYAEATVEGDVVVDPKAHTASVTFTLKAGERYNIGRVLVTGTSKVPKDKVAREVTDAAPPGSQYSDTALQDAQSRVFDMNVFSLAKVTRGAPDPDTHTLPLSVDVTEAPFRTLRAGGGLGVERERDEIRGQGEYVNRNFFGGLRRLDFDNKLAYVVTPDVLNYFKGEGEGGFAGYSKLTFTQPDLFLNDLDLNLTGQLQRDIEVGYTYNSALAGVSLEKKFGRKLDVLAGYNFQVLQLNTLVNSAVLTGSRAPQLATACPEGDQSCFLVLEYLEQRVTLDFRDNRIQPHEGLFAQIDFQEGGGPGSSFTYLRVEPDVRGYIPLSKRLVFAERLQWGWMKAFGTESDGSPAPTPLTQRFFGGGAEGVRAYGSRLMSPVVVVCRDTNTDATQRKCSLSSDQEAIPVGGDGLYASSSELRLDVGHNVGVVGFLDVGLVPVEPFDVRLEDVAVAPGIGFRYYTLFGPVRLDLAYRLPNTAARDGQLRLAPSQVVINYPPSSGATFISPGQTSRFDFQFSIGEAF